MTSPALAARAASRGYLTSRAIGALEVLAEGPVSAAELAERLRVAAVTARRLLQRLELDGYASRGPGKHDPFVATPMLGDLGARLAAITGTPCHADQSTAAPRAR